MTLDDISGIQVRSGCFCAGPFVLVLMDIRNSAMSEIKEEINMGIWKDKPGYIRLDLTFYLEEYEVEYIAKALLAIAKFYP